MKRNELAGAETGAGASAEAALARDLRVQLAELR